MSLELMITLAGLAVAGFASVLGIWVERDKTKPPRFAYALSMLILLATGVGMFQSYMDALAGEKMEGDLARMLATLDKIANESDVEIPELQALVKDEMSAQSRANPDVIQKVAQRVSDEGGDPAAVMGSYLPPGEVEAMNRKGTLKVKPAAVTPVVVGDNNKAPPRRDRPRPTLKALQEKAANPPPPPAPREPEPEPEETAAAAPEPVRPAAGNPMLAAAAPRPAPAKAAPAPAPKPTPKQILNDPKKAAADAKKAAAEQAKAAAAAAQAQAKAKADAAKKAAADAAKKKADAAKKAAADAVKKKTDAAKKKADSLKKGLGF